MRRSTKVCSQVAIIAVLLVSLLLGGCAPRTTSQDEVGRSPLPTPIPVGSVTTSSAEEIGQEIALIYKRSGGFAGLDEQFTIYRDGRISSNDGRERRVDAQEVALLLQEIEQLGFLQMEANYMPEDSCCDRFFYELTVYSGDQAITVSTIDGAPSAPDELWQALELVQDFL